MEMRMEMKKARILLWLILPAVLCAVLLAGCAQVAPTASVSQNPSDLPLTDQFAAIRQAADAYLSGKQVEPITAEELYAEYVKGRNAQYILVDIRAREDFVSGNIRGSLNIPYALTADIKKLANLPKDKTLVVIDYNGHWAAQTAVTWNMLGYQAVPLQFGMQSWSKDPAACGYEVFPSEPLHKPLVSATAERAQYSLPELKMPEGEVKELIRKLTVTYLDRNYKGFVEAGDLMAVLDGGSATQEYYLVDVRQPQHYQAGHLPSSINIPLARLAKIENLQGLPQDKKIVLVGYDGLDASQGARILVTLGYNAVALKYGLSYWSGEEKVTGIKPIRSLVKECPAESVVLNAENVGDGEQLRLPAGDCYRLTPLNYLAPSTGPAGCG
jgi:rhodanese-related sulfurtransferase